MQGLTRDVGAGRAGKVQDRRGYIPGAAQTLQRDLLGQGFALRVRQRGSHVVMKREDADGGTVGCVVPLHRELAIGRLRGILRQAQVTPDEFMEHIWASFSAVDC